MNSIIMKKNLVPFTLLLAVAVMFSFTAVNDKNAVPTTAKIGLEIGDEAPNIVMKGVDGKDLKLSSLRGKLVLIDFWASWCGPCKQIAPVITKLNQLYTEKKCDYQYIEIDIDERMEMFPEFEPEILEFSSTSEEESETSEESLAEDPEEDE